jgi:hypothetical protein
MQSTECCRCGRRRLILLDCLAAEPLKCISLPASKPNLLFLTKYSLPHQLSFPPFRDELSGLRHTKLCSQCEPGAHWVGVINCRHPWYPYMANCTKPGKPDSQHPSGCIPTGTDGWGCNCANGTEPCDVGQSCLWFSDGCSIGCEKCDGLGGNPNTADRCHSGMNATVSSGGRHGVQNHHTVGAVAPGPAISPLCQTGPFCLRSVGNCISHARDIVFVALTTRFLTMQPHNPYRHPLRSLRSLH